MQTAGGSIPVGVYRPLASASTPLLIWFHGGGFVVGDLDAFDAPLRALANRCACTVLSVDFRLAPEHSYPAAIEDAHAALCWAAAHAAELGADSQRVVVGGDSAGGNIATVAAMLARDRGGPEVALEVLLYPDADARPGINHASWREHDGRILERASKDRQLATVLPALIDQSQPHISPALATPANLRGLPPALVVTGEFDPQRDEEELYAARLRDAAVPVSLVRYPGMIHGFFQMAGRTRRRPACDGPGRSGDRRPLAPKWPVSGARFTNSKPLPGSVQVIPGEGLHDRFRATSGAGRRDG